MGADCSSLTELLLAEKIGFRGEEIMFTSNNTLEVEFVEAARLGAVINLDDIRHIETLEQSTGIPELVSFRYNPGEARFSNALIGSPQEAKYGLTRDQIIDAFRIIKAKGAKRFALHTMIVSNELNANCFVETARLLFKLAVKIKRETGIRIETINLGGGIGIPYRPEEKAINLNELSTKISALYREIIVPRPRPDQSSFECGRMVTGPYGYLISKVLA